MISLTDFSMCGITEIILKWWNLSKIRFHLHHNWHENKSEGNFVTNILCFVDPASRYNRVKKTNLMHNLFLVHVHLVNLYMFRAYLGPSSGGTTVCIQQLVIINLFRWLSVVLVGLDSNPKKTTIIYKNNKYQLLYTYGCTSWWWA